MARTLQQPTSPPKPLDVGARLTLGHGRWARSYKVISVGPAVVVVRDGQGWTVTLMKGEEDGEATDEQAATELHSVFHALSGTRNED